jgi:hypothetical protein
MVRRWLDRCCYPIVHYTRWRRLASAWQNPDKDHFSAGRAPIAALGLSSAFSTIHGRCPRARLSSQGLSYDIKTPPCLNLVLATLCCCQVPGWFRHAGRRWTASVARSEPPVRFAGRRGNSVRPGRSRTELRGPMRPAAFALARSHLRRRVPETVGNGYPNHPPASRAVPALWSCCRTGCDPSCSFHRCRRCSPGLSGSSPSRCFPALSAV